MDIFKSMVFGGIHPLVMTKQANVIVKLLQNTENHSYCRRFLMIREGGGVEVEKWKSFAMSRRTWGILRLSATPLSV